MNPYWIEDKGLKKGEVDFLPTIEIKFWQDLLEKYLAPIDEDKAEKVMNLFTIYQRGFVSLGISYLVSIRPCSF